MARSKSPSRVRSTSALNLLRRVVADENGCSPKDVMRDVGRRRSRGGGGGGMLLSDYDPFPDPPSSDTKIVDLGPTGRVDDPDDDGSWPGDDPSSGKLN